MSNSIAPGSSADVNVKVTALTTNPNVPVTYKTIILKKNLVNEVNTLTQEMMSAQNTKYVIKYDYVLGEDITIPVNCILQFDGGSIAGEYTITGNNTDIEAGLVKIFNTYVTLSGTWNIAEAYPEWFGAKGDGVTDDTEALCKVVYASKVIKCNYKANYVFTPDYQNDKRIYLTNHIIYGNDCTFTVNGADDEVGLFFVNEPDNTQDPLINAANVELYDMTIAGVGSYEVAPSQSWMGSGYTSSNIVGFHCVGKSNLIAKNIKFKNLLFGIRSGESSRITGDSSLVIENCTWDADCIMPVLAQRYSYTTINDCNVRCKANTSTFIHHFYLKYLKGVAHISNCDFIGGTGHALTLTSCEEEIFVSGCYFDTNHFAVCCDLNEKKIIFDNCFMQSDIYDGTVYIQRCDVLFTNCIIKNIATNEYHYNFCIKIIDEEGGIGGGTAEFVGCYFYSEMLINENLYNNSFVSITNSVLNLSNPSNSINNKNASTGSKIIISHSTINTELAVVGVLAEIDNSIVCKIIDCIINRTTLGDFLFAPNADMFDNFYFNNCLAYNVSAIYSSDAGVVQKGNMTGSQII